MIERLFQLSDHGTNVRTEVLAGFTTFLTMAYIIFVNPAILADAGMDQSAVFVATCLAAAVGTAIMGLYANYPIALAPGMGLQDLSLISQLSLLLLLALPYAALALFGIRWNPPRARLGEYDC